MNPHRTIHPRESRGRLAGRGFTLVELMVAMAIGLVLALVVSLSVLGMGMQFRKVGAGSGAEINAQVALSMLDDAGRAAGAGLFNNGQPLCSTLNARRSDGTVVADGSVLMPLRLADGGGAGNSDTVVFTALRAVGAMSGTPVMVGMAGPLASVVVNDATTLQAGDLALVGVPGNAAVPCTLFAVTAAPAISTLCGGNATQCRVLLRDVSNPHNAPLGGFTSQPRYGFTSAGGVVGPATVHRVGTAFVQEAFARCSAARWCATTPSRPRPRARRARWASAPVSTPWPPRWC